MPLIPDIKTCNKCGEELEVGKNWAKSHKANYNYNCSACLSKKQVENDHNMRQKWGMKSRDYDALLKSQGGGCAICGKTEDSEGRRLAFDHDHAVEEYIDIRGILCNNCNNALGKFKDNVNTLMNAIHYLNKDLHKIKREA